MTNNSDELIFDVLPRVDTTSHGTVAHPVNLTAIRDGHPGRSNIRKYDGSKDFGQRFARAIKTRLLDRRLSESDAVQHRSAANRFMEFFSRNGFEEDTIPSRQLLVKFADDLELTYGNKIPTDIPRVYRTVVNIFKTMCPTLVAPRPRFVRVDTSGTEAAPQSPSIEEVRKGANNYCAAKAAFVDFKRVSDRISLGRTEATSEGKDLLDLIAEYPNASPAKHFTRASILRLLYRQPDFKPIPANEFDQRFDVRPDHCLHFPAPGRAATAGASLMQTGLVGTFRWVLPTATDLMGAVVLCLENTGWNRSTILTMKSSMISEALSTACDGKSRIRSWKGRARRLEETSCLTGPGSLLDVLATVQVWNAPLRESIVEELSMVQALLRRELTDGRRRELEKRRAWLDNMKDRLWLCLGSAPVGVTRLKPNDVSAKCFRAMFEDNQADIQAIGNYNCYEARLNYLARAERGRDVQLELLRAINRHRSVSTTLQHYASKLPGALKRDGDLAQFSKSIMSRDLRKGVHT